MFLEGGQIPGMWTSNLAGCLAGCLSVLAVCLSVLAGWLAVWLAGCLFWLAGWLSGWLPKLAKGIWLEVDRKMQILLSSCVRN